MANKVAQREHLFIVFGAVAFVGLLLLFFYVRPQLIAINRLQTNVATLNDSLNAMKKQSAEITKERDKLSTIETQLKSRGTGFALYNTLVALTAQHKFVNPKITSLPTSRRPGENAPGEYDQSFVTLDLWGASLDQLRDFVYDLYAAKSLIIVTQLALEPNFTNERGMHVSMAISTLTQGQ